MKKLIIFSLTILLFIGLAQSQPINSKGSQFYMLVPAEDSGIPINISSNIPNDNNPLDTYFPNIEPVYDQDSVITGTQESANRTFENRIKWNWLSSNNFKFNQDQCERILSNTRIYTGAGQYNGAKFHVINMVVPLNAICDYNDWVEAAITQVENAQSISIPYPCFRIITQYQFYQYFQQSE